MPMTFSDEELLRKLKMRMMRSSLAALSAAARFRAAARGWLMGQDV